MSFATQPRLQANLFYCLLLALPARPAVSAEFPQLPTVTVISDPSNALDSEASGRTIAREEIETTQKTDLNALLRGENGVQLAQSTASTSTGISVGGASGGLGLITLDGVPMFANVTGAYSLQHLPGDFIERIAIQRAGGGQLSTSRTLGGAIQLASRELQDEAYAKFETGNYGTFRGGAGKGWSTPFGDWTTLVQRQDITDGLTQASPDNGNRESDNYQLWSGLLRGRKRFAHGDADATLLYSRGREDLDGPGLLPSGKLGWMDAPGLGYNQTWLAQGHARQQLASHWQSSVQLGMTRNRQDVDIPLLPYTYTGNLWLLRWQNQHDVINRATARQPAVSVNWGIDLQQQHGEALLSNRPVTLASTLTSAGAFLQGRAGWQDWHLIAETRLEDHGDYGSKALFSAKLAKKIGDSLQFWLAGGSGFRPPAVNERLNPLFGTTDLQPERVTSAEAGGQWQVSSGTLLKLNFSHRDYRQLIVLQFDSKTGRTRSANIPQAEIWLLETEWRHSWHDDWQTGLNYTFMDAHDPLTGLEVPIRTAHQGNLWQSWQVNRQLQLRMELNVRDSFWFDKANTQKNTPAPRLNVSANYLATPLFELYLRCENVNNERSPEVNTFSYPGVSFFGGVKARF